MTSVQNKRVGYWVTDKKYKILNIERLESACKDHRIDLIKLDLEGDFERQGHFDLIFHKMTDLLFKFNDKATTFNRFQTFTLKHPEIPLIDPLHHIVQLFNRPHLHQLLQQSTLFNDGGLFFTPASVEVMCKEDAVCVLKSHSIPYPIVCKSSLAVHNTNNQTRVNAAQMTIVLNEEGLEGLEYPRFMQAFVNHNAILWKVYVVGGDHFMVKRNSIKNLYPHSDQTPIRFSSKQISKSSSSSPLSELGGDELLAHPERVVDGGQVARLVAGLRRLLHLDLFGFDLILENDSGRYGVIDINPFPSYDGVEGFVDSMIRLFESKWLDDSVKADALTASNHSTFDLLSSSLSELF